MCWAPTLALSLSPVLSAIYELNRTLSLSLEPWALLPTPCSVLWLQQPTSWLPPAHPNLSQEPRPKPILSSWPVSYLISLHPSLSLLSQPLEPKKPPCTALATCHPFLMAPTHAHSNFKHEGTGNGKR